LERCATETGFGIVPLEKVVRLGELVGDIGRHPLLGSSLALKGGTAVNLCFGSPTRLSIDLDFNCIGDPEREAMLKRRPHVEAAIEELARRHGYVPQRSADAFAGRKLYLRFESVDGVWDRIEVDLNFLFRVPIGARELRSLWQPGELESPKVQVVSADELCIGKLLALLDRTAPRDAWDVGLLPTIAPDILANEQFRSRFVAMSSILPRPPTSYTIERLVERITPRTVSEQLVPTLASDRGLSAEEIVQNAWAVMAPLLRLTHAERQFIDGVAQGELLIELLNFNKPEEAQIVGKHPALQWKLRNVREFMSRSENSQDLPPGNPKRPVNRRTLSEN
jgi:hypothetical protein